MRKVTALRLGCGLWGSQSSEIRCCSLVLHRCPFGFFSDPKNEYKCSSAVSRYQKWVSAAHLDRFYVFVEAPRVDYEDLADEVPAQDSGLVAAA